jgi:hypothetical protein
MKMWTSACAPHFSSAHNVETVAFRGWKGLRNGDLLRAAESHFDAFITLDNDLPDQQNIPAFDNAVVVLRPVSQGLEHLARLVAELEERIPTLRPGELTRIFPPSG